MTLRQRIGKTLYTAAGAMIFILCFCAAPQEPPPDPAPTPTPQQPQSPPEVHPCPPPPEADCPPPRTRVVKVNAECEPCETPQPQVAVPTKTAPEPCVFGQVNTAGDLILVVKRARVAVIVDDEVLGDTWSDANGHYVWCDATGRIQDGTRVQVKVEKKPFFPAVHEQTWNHGTHLHVSFALVAEGLTN